MGDRWLEAKTSTSGARCLRMPWARARQSIAAIGRASASTRNAFMVATASGDHQRMCRFAKTRNPVGGDPPFSGNAVQDLRCSDHDRERSVAAPYRVPGNKHFRCGGGRGRSKLESAWRGKDALIAADPLVDDQGHPLSWASTRLIPNLMLAGC